MRDSCRVFANLFERFVKANEHFHRAVGNGGFAGGIYWADMVSFSKDLPDEKHI